MYIGSLGQLPVVQRLTHCFVTYTCHVHWGHSEIKQRHILVMYIGDILKSNSVIYLSRTLGTFWNQTASYTCHVHWGHSEIKQRHILVMYIGDILKSNSECHWRLEEKRIRDHIYYNSVGTFVSLNNIYSEKTQYLLHIPVQRYISRIQILE